VWNSETGKNFANLKGHQGGIYSIKMAGDGSFAVSVGTDKKIMLWDIRVSKSVGHIETDHLPDMNDIALSNSTPQDLNESMPSQ
jgi:WD40 repeat protein